MKILVVAVGKLRKPYFRDGCEDYIRRIQRLSPFEVREIKPGKGDDIGSAQKSEDERILAVLDSVAFKTAALHDRGERVSSEKFARLLKEVEMSGATGLAFVVGGANGLGKKVLDQADSSLSLGTMTMSHELARLVLFEQIYRAQTILRGVPYPK